MLQSHLRLRVLFQVHWLLREFIFSQLCDTSSLPRHGRKRVSSNMHEVSYIMQCSHESDNAITFTGPTHTQGEEWYRIIQQWEGCWGSILEFCLLQRSNERRKILLLMVTESCHYHHHCCRHHQLRFWEPRRCEWTHAKYTKILTAAAICAQLAEFRILHCHPLGSHWFKVPLATVQE